MQHTYICLVHFAGAVLDTPACCTPGLSQPISRLHVYITKQLDQNLMQPLSDEGTSSNTITQYVYLSDMIKYCACTGGPSPYWLGCEYPFFTGFLIVNGIAFMLAVASAVVVTAFPLVLSRTPHQAAWWGGILLMLSMLAFIVAFLMAGFVTVGYKAPAPSCSSLQCTEGGVACNFEIVAVAYDDADNVNSTAFVMDQNVATLNAISNSSSSAMCLTYNRSVSHGPTSSTLYPWSPPSSSSANGTDDPEATEAVTKLLLDPIVGLQTVCMDATNFPTAIDPSLSENNLAINVPYDVEDLGDFLDTNGVGLFDILPNRSFVNLFPYTSNYFCMSNETEDTMKFNVLCDAALQSERGNLSVSKGGAYIRAVTAADSGATLFETDLTAKQVAKAIKALGGVFAFICLIIIVFLVKSKWF